MQYEMILCFSGGIDSYVAWHYLDRPQTLYFHCQSRYTMKEIPVISSLVPNTILDFSLNLRDREIGEKAYIPFRNLLFALQAVKYSDTIVIAGVADDMVSDKNESIFKEFSELMTKLEGRPISVISPFWSMTKSDVVKWYLDNIGDELSLLQTVSCYSSNPTETYCGKCPSCFRKWVALRSNGVDIAFYNRDLMKTYLDSAIAGKYMKERNENIFKTVTEYDRTI